MSLRPVAVVTLMRMEDSSVKNMSDEKKLGGETTVDKYAKYNRKVGPQKGPGGGKGPKGPGPKIQNPGKLLKRVLGYTFGQYPIHWIVVMIFAGNLVYENPD